MKRFLLGLLTGIALSWLFRKREDCFDTMEEFIDSLREQDSLDDTQPIVKRDKDDNIKSIYSRKLDIEFEPISTTGKWMPTGCLNRIDEIQKGSEKCQNGLA